MKITNHQLRILHPDFVTIFIRCGITTYNYLQNSSRYNR